MQKTSLTKLAKQVANRKKEKQYKQGSEDEKVWLNFQVSKKTKRKFNDKCKEKSVNASLFFRNCIEVFLKNEGDVSFLLNILKSEDS